MKRYTIPQLLKLMERDLDRCQTEFERINVRAICEREIKERQKWDNLREIEIPTMENWLLTGAIWETSRGEENIYFVSEFGHEFFCKCL